MPGQESPESSPSAESTKSVEDQIADLLKEFEKRKPLEPQLARLERIERDSKTTQDILDIQAMEEELAHIINIDGLFDKASKLIPTVVIDGPLTQTVGSLLILPNGMVIYKNFATIPGKLEFITVDEAAEKLKTSVREDQKAIDELTPRRDAANAALAKL